jgi:hypothetical protein
MRGTRISLWFTKIRIRRQFGEGFILEGTVPKKNRSAIRFSVSNFFHELLDWQVTERLRRCIRLRARAYLRARHAVPRKIVNKI